MRAPLLALALVCSPTTALAQEGGDIALDGFRPPLDTNGYVTVDGAALAAPSTIAFGLYTTWAHGLLRLDGADSSYRVRDVLSPTLVASIGVPRLPVALGLSLPFGVVSATLDDARTSGQGLGDLGVHAKVGLGRRAALAASVWLPTAEDDTWLGAGAVSGQVRLVVEGHRGRLRGALNAGVRVRAGGAAEFAPSMMPRIALGAALPVGGAIAYELQPGKLDAVAETWALVPLSRDGYAPVEALAGLKVHLAASSHFTIGGGLGLGPDNGNPDARAFLAIVFAPGRAASTHAAIEDAPERLVQVAVNDDRDGDEIVDRLDGCPDDPEDFDQLEDGDGCPEDDVDGDHIIDEADLCAKEAEDFDGDGDDDGCPDRDLIKFTGGSIDTLEPIHFEFDSAVIKEESYPVVRAVAAALRQNPRIRQVEIGGHTDRSGSAAYNLRLSRDRAASVRAFLIGEGIAPDRLEAKGYGESQPLDERGAPAAANRRVEFVIRE